MDILRNVGGETLDREGALEGTTVPDLLHAICQPGRTGTLTLSRGEVTKTVYVQGGSLVFAASTVSEERLGETLLRMGVLGCRELEEAVGLLGGGKRLGSILVELGHLEPANLVRGVLHQVREIILSLFTWQSGRYRFLEEPLPTDEVITLNVPTAKIICDGVRRIESWSTIARGVGSPRSSYRLSRDGRLLAEELDLGGAERQMLNLLEEPRTVAGICQNVFLPNFEVYQYLWAFRVLGIVRQVESEEDRIGTSQEGWQGSLAESQVPSLLLGLCRSDETGVLLLGRDGEEKSIHLKDGRIVFATSNRPEESLTSFLLRRGVIGVRDKEEIERKILTNKRPGTILRDLGVLTQDELGRFVREQLRQIVLSVFAWESGWWQFLPGELPTFETITLDRPIEEVILQGTRAVRSWSRVRDGCGDLSTRLLPSADLRSVLSGIELGPDEKEVLGNVDEPRTVGEILRRSEVPEFRAAQILWAYRLLGVVSAEVSLPAGEGAAEARAAAGLAAAEPARDSLLEGVAGTERTTDAFSEDASGDVGDEAMRPAPSAVTHGGPIAPAGEGEDAHPDRPRDEGPELERGAGERASEEPFAEGAAAISPLAPQRAAGGEDEAALSAESLRDERIEERTPLGGGDAGQPEAESAPCSARPAWEGPEGTSAAEAMEEKASPDLAEEVYDSWPQVQREDGPAGAEASEPEVAPPAEPATGEWAFEGAFPAVAAAEGAGPGDIEQDETPAELLPQARRSALEAVGTGVLEEFERFNRRHREVYAVLKGAAGAGARNLVLSCIRKLGDEEWLFEGLSMDETGAFPAPILFERIGSQRPSEIRRHLELLIAAEAAFASRFLDARTLQQLTARIELAASDVAVGPS